jgi:hypothetical protein
VDFEPRETAMTAYDPSALLRMPGIEETLTGIGRELTRIHDETPRVVHYVSDLRRWLITQIALSLYFDQQTGADPGGLTASRLLKLEPLKRYASRNTVSAHLLQMRRFNIFTVEAQGDMRTRPLIPVEEALRLIRIWLDEHLAALDNLDGGDRLAFSRANPSLLQHAQPRIARTLLADPAWADPPESIAIFTLSGMGSNLLHDLISRVSLPRNDAGRLPIGPLRPRSLVARYGVSRSQVIRLLARAQSVSDIGWADPPYGGEAWISKRLFDSYLYWQAVKLAAVSRAFVDASERLAS